MQTMTSTPEIIRPSGGAGRAGGSLGTVGLLVLVVVATTYRRTEDIVSTLIAVAVGLLFMAGFAVALLRSRLEIRPGEVVRRGPLRSTRIVSASLDRLVWLPTVHVGNGTQTRLVAIDRSGRPAFRLGSGLIWSQAEVVKVARALATGARVVNIDQPVTPAMVKALEPAALPWPERNPGKLVALSVLGTFGFIAVLFGIFLITS